jgi:CheY-like chemotaxis protein
MRILVAEDDPRLAALLEQSLAEAGWAVDVHRGGRRAFDAALREGGSFYDVLLLDWMLPEMDGVNVLGVIAAGRRTGRGPPYRTRRSAVRETRSQPSPNDPRIASVPTRTALTVIGTGRGRAAISRVSSTGTCSTKAQ